MLATVAYFWETYVASPVIADWPGWIAPDLAGLGEKHSFHFDLTLSVGVALNG